MTMINANNVAPKENFIYHSKDTNVSRQVASIANNGKIHFEIIDGPCKGRKAWNTPEEWQAWCLNAVFVSE